MCVCVHLCESLCLSFSTATICIYFCYAFDSNIVVVVVVAVVGTYLLACFFHNYFWFFVQTHNFWFLFTAVCGRSDQASIFCDELLLPTP